MSRRGPVAVDRALWQELVTVLDQALRDGARRALGRLADREGLASDEALHELAAWPGRACVAVEPGAGVSPAKCRAGQGCPVEEECPLVRGGGAPAIARCALAQLVAGCVRGWERPLPEAPFASLAELRPLADELLERSGRVGPGSPPRARTAPAVLDLALRRGGPFGATGPYLGGPELEQVAAFIPPGSGRGDTRLGPVEAWLRRAAAAEVALVDLSR